jgi:hypothetical protein
MWLPAQTSLIFLAPDQCLPDDFILVGVDEMLEKPVVRFLVNERSKTSAFLASPYMQLDNMVVMMFNTSLKRRPVSHFFPNKDAHYSLGYERTYVGVYEKTRGLRVEIAGGAAVPSIARTPPC